MKDVERMTPEELMEHVNIGIVVEEVKGDRVTLGFVAFEDGKPVGMVTHTFSAGDRLMLGAIAVPQEGDEPKAKAVEA